MSADRFLAAVRLAAGAAVLAALAACGGGGGGGGEPERLVVTLDYPVALADAEVMRPLSVNATLVGLNGHRPHCRVSAGSLPPGLSLEDDCGISGTPTQGGTYSFTVRLTADDVSGSLDFPWSMDVLDPTPTLVVVRSYTGVGVIGNDIDVLIPVGDNIYHQSLVDINQTLAPGDTVSYSLEGSLPTGLRFNPATGQLDGTVTQTGQFDLRVGARLQRQGHRFDATPVAVRLYISPVVATYSWSGCGLNFDNTATVRWLSAVTCTLSVQGLQSGDHWVLTDLATRGDASYDALSQTLSVPAMPEGGAELTATLQVTLADARQYQLNTRVAFWVRSPLPDWDDDSGLFSNLAGVMQGPGVGPSVNATNGRVRVQANQPIALDPISVTDGEPGDVYRYSLVAAPNQTLPTWLSINPATGRVSGKPPALTPGQSQDAVVRLSTTRGGQQVSSDFTWHFEGPP